MVNQSFSRPILEGGDTQPSACHRCEVTEILLLRAESCSPPPETEKSR
ncbi:hypothetical protein NP493_175g02000 [Ridgeia piscesae]|uniref:Uncharacterized protein n=1 Tax=Ridgeia piscesae TaxID=27915 RepID=A0AAD9P301_RIDPI|nr:hypothetical protein NP493_175g02000 [Ridgeia piscesae]